MLILASASPRRAELLTQAGFRFEVCASAIAEARNANEQPIPYCARLAREKAEAVFALLQARALDAAPDSAGLHGQTSEEVIVGELVVLGADTIVVTSPQTGAEVLGKPADAADAARMLDLLAGATHQVMTGVCVVSRLATEVAVEVTCVTMLTPSAEEIAAYIGTGEPMDKAGAYAIQGYAARWIPRVQGCYFNVVGLPLALAASMIEGMERRLRMHPQGEQKYPAPAAARSA
ncbi:MAG TPA: Maf family protein [Acidisarcina sp.]